MNSPPSSRYSAASAPITPTSDKALEMGCVCTTRLMPQITAIAAKIRNRIVSISGEQGYQQPGDEQIDQRDGEHKGPGEAHQLIVAKTRESRADPDEHKQDRADLGGKPKKRQQNRLHYGDQEKTCRAQKQHAENGESDPIERSRRVGRMEETQYCAGGENQNGYQTGTILLRENRMPTA